MPGDKLLFGCNFQFCPDTAGSLAMTLTWIGFIISLAVILTISQRNLPLALFLGAIILGAFTQSFSTMLERVLFTVTNPSIIFLTAAMIIIPVIGGAMKENGQIDSLVNNIRIPKRHMMPFSAALMGLLPMPGGALLSAPILDKAGKDIDSTLVATINNWYRHLFILVYPLAPALIVAAEIADIDVYHAILYLLPWALLANVLGYFFYLRKVHGKISHPAGFSRMGLIIPLVVILAAPFIDFVLKKFFGFGNEATLIGVSAGLFLSAALSHKKVNLWKVVVTMKAWNFGLIILGMFLYLHIFQASNARELIAGLPLPPLILAVTAGFVLGASTGRVHLPASIIFPVYLGIVNNITPFYFAVVYTSIYFGYIISPVHPCLVVTCQYFGIPIKDIIKDLAIPTLIMFFAVLLAAFIA
ncbi:MAG: DUF401 family protein [candidate division Zixibacteria bacterium]|nr:DUF401 family protein [candidate division Zixibacteria bacterium]